MVTPASKNEMLRWLLPVLLALFSLGISGFLGYNNTDKEMSLKIKGIEVQQTNDDERLGRIEMKLDRLDDKATALLEKIEHRP